LIFYWTYDAMKNLIASALMLLAPALVVAQTGPAAQPTTKPASAKPVTAAKAKPATAPKAANTAASKNKTTTAKAQQTSSRTQLKSAANQVATGIIAAEAALSPEELSIAERVHVGRIPCELGAVVNITADSLTPGYFHVEGKGFKYRMTPVATTTGAVRLEDQKAGAVWLQIANKSMLMNQKLGQRMADECMSPQQYVVAEAIKKTPQESVFDAPKGSK
jgi:hypothetical protein